MIYQPQTLSIPQDWSQSKSSLSLWECRWSVLDWPSYSYIQVSIQEANGNPLLIYLSVWRVLFRKSSDMQTSSLRSSTLRCTLPPRHSLASPPLLKSMHITSVRITIISLPFPEDTQLFLPLCVSHFTTDLQYNFLTDNQMKAKGIKELF